MRGPPILAALGGGVLAALAITAFWLWRAAPVPMPDAPGGRFACVSYAPFRGEQTPFDQSLVIPPQQIAEDLARLKTETGCVRTYAVNQGLDQVLPIAEKLGMKVLMGLWIGRDARDNDIQIARGVELAQAHPGTVKGIIVGNEVLLRQEQPAPVLENLLQRVKAETGLPVTYADVWEFWLRHPELADDVDFVTIHILPYWEDDPVPASEGVAHIDAILRVVHAEMPGKMIYIGETGYPSAGKQREQAVPGLVEQAGFIRGFLAYAHEHGLDYNVIEAFDQPWKRALEGTVGGYWGVFDEDRASKFPLTGPVARMGNLWPWLGATLVLGIMLWWPARRAAPSALLALAAPLLAGAAALAILLQIDHARFAAWHWHEWAIEASLALISALVAVLALPRILAGKGAEIAAAEQSLAWLRRPWTRWPDGGLALGALQLIAVAGAAVVALGLDFDQRYRDFPIWAFAVPALGFALLRLRATRQSAAGRMPIEFCFASLLALSAVFIALNENVFTRPEMRQSVVAAFGPALRGEINGTSLIWCLMLLVIAYPWFAIRRGVRLPEPAVGSSSLHN
jgi:exo-beta-1,3-glucanase (GH17 family)